ncbi:hypothetical protein ACIRRI_46010 [Streptomyces mirabilis]|uniref:hypothetical protein n=1 Tax=Streptomyces mirabilis TaxID=68239 RepID=UPI0037F7B2BE
MCPAPPLLVEQLVKISAACPDNLMGLRDRALVLMHFAVAGREHELAFNRVRDYADTPAGIQADLQAGRLGPALQGACRLPRSRRPVGGQRPARRAVGIREQAFAAPKSEGIWDEVRTEGRRPAAGPRAAGAFRRPTGANTPPNSRLSRRADEELAHREGAADKPRWYHQGRASGGWHAPRLVRVWIVAPLAVLGAVGAGYLIYRFVVDPLVANTSDAIKLTLAILTLIGAVLAGVYAYRKQRIAESDAHRADANQFADRYTTAAGQLGHDKAAVRLAGVYALARLADDWEEQRQVCIDVLCAYLHMPYQTNPDATGYKEGEREVRHVIRLIRDHLRLSPLHPHSWQGHDFDFTAVTFDGGDLSGAVFSGGTVTFNAAKFSGATVTFNAAEFSGGTVTFSFGLRISDGTVSMDGAVFSGGTVSFDRAVFSDGTVSIDEAVFSGATVDLRSVASWAKPPLFHDEALSNPPAGLLLPSVRP